MSRSSSSGPRMHDYTVPDSANVAHLRPGVVGVPTDPITFYLPDTSRTGTLPVPVPVIGNIANGRSIFQGGSSSTLFSLHSGGSYAYSDEAIGGWSLPNSSVRSRSYSPPSDDEDEQEYAEMDDTRRLQTYRHSPLDFDEKITGQNSDKVDTEVPDEEWDGMDMDMDL
jgi:hypothetical protein